MVPSHLLFLLLLPLLFSMATSEDACSITRCSPTEVPVHFPFRLVSDHQSCGYPGFELSCDSLNRTVVHIESWGEFLVRGINYATQEIQINDQDNCLPRRLLNMSLPGSPFGYNAYLSYSFYNCSANSTTSFLEPIACLSTTNYTIFAAPDRSVWRPFISCDLLASAMVPGQLKWYGYGYGYGYATEVNDGVSLSWDVPNCHECIARGGRCGFKNRRSNEIECFGLATKRGHSSTHSSTVKYALSVGLGIPILVSIILITCYLWGRFKSNGTTNHHHHRHHESAVLPQPAVFVMGLDEAVIQSYPMTVLGESRLLVKPEDNICSICLSEYRPKDTLRTIPSCEHCFHAGCIDKWLRRNGTCPLCRDSPKPALPSAV